MRKVIITAIICFLLLFGSLTTIVFLLVCVVGINANNIIVSNWDLNKHRNHHPRQKLQVNCTINVPKVNYSKAKNEIKTKYRIPIQFLHVKINNIAQKRRKPKADPSFLRYVNLYHEHIAVGIGAAGLFKRPALKGVFIAHDHARKTRYAESFELGTHWSSRTYDDRLGVFR